MCLMSRMQAFWTVKCSMADTAKIHNPADMWPLPWDDEDDEDDEPPISKEEEEEMVEYINDINSGKIKFEW